MALLKAIVRNFLLRRSCSSSPSASDLFSVTISHEQWINFISFNEMHLGLYLHPLNLKEKEVINGNGFECPLNWGSHILKPKTLETARLWDEFDHKPRVDFKFSMEFIGFNWKLSWLKTRKFLYRYSFFFDTKLFLLRRVIKFNAFSLQNEVDWCVPAIWLFGNFSRLVLFFFKSKGYSFYLVTTIL